jgi:hypothetical protein
MLIITDMFTLIFGRDKTPAGIGSPNRGDQEKSKGLDDPEKIRFKNKIKTEIELIIWKMEVQREGNPNAIEISFWLNTSPARKSVLLSPEEYRRLEEFYSKVNNRNGLISGYDPVHDHSVFRKSNEHCILLGKTLIKDIQC